MGSTKREIAHNFSPHGIINKDGSIDRLSGNEIEENLSSRLFLPTSVDASKKLPLLLYYHGGGFCIETPFSLTYHSYLKTLVAEAEIIAVSVDYRRAPEHPIPVPYDDSWTPLKWAASLVNGDGPEEWLNIHADFGRVYFAGDSAGAWRGCDDPLINPIKDARLPSLGGSKMLVFIAGNDVLRDRGWLYYETLNKNGWGGKVEIMEAKEEVHVFHLSNPSSVNAVAMRRKFISFMHEDR
uniref:Alpha/beta hydrolase fold-3 domain-containing protein n=1 Tax=Populus trichocarpa TaxID=3694 RepID=B9HRY7_POPTR